jgi:PBSX family phage terminase large subunit
LDYSCILQEAGYEAPYINAFWDTIVDITFERNGEFYDLTVPNLEHYSASGLYHHNSGKSWIGAYDLLKRAMTPEMAGKMFMVVAPTYTLLRDASQRTTIELAEELGIIRERFKQPPELILNNGATIIFRSGEDPEKLRGPNISGIWLDEASIMDEEVWKISIGRLREGGVAGFITATFTPKGMSHWTYEKFGKGDTPNTKFFRSRTKDNPFLSGEFIRALEQNYDEKTAKQELEGDFVSMDGVEWPNEYFGEHIWIDKFPEAHDLTISAMSLDPSKGKNARHGDYSTTIRLGRDKAGILYVDADLRRCDSETLIAYFIGEVADFYPDVIGIEVNQFQHLLSGEIAKGMKKHNIDIPIIELYNNIQKEVRIRRLGPYLSNKKFRFVRSPGTNLLVSQLREFPLGKHDDGPDGLEMALRVMISTWNGRMGRKAKRVIA